MATEIQDETLVTLADMLDSRAESLGRKIAYTFLLNGEVEAESVYPQGLEFIQELAAFAFEEAAGGSKLGGIAVEARAEGEDRWQLFGTKYLDGVAQGASVSNVFARHYEPPGVSAFVAISRPESRLDEEVARLEQELRFRS